VQITAFLRFQVDVRRHLDGKVIALGRLQAAGGRLDTVNSMPSRRQRLRN